MIQWILARALRKLRGSAIRGSRIDPTSKVESGSTVVDSSFGRHSFCGYDCNILHADIGAFCSLAGRVSIGGARHPMEYASTSPVFLSHKDSVKAKFSRHDYLPIVRTAIGHDVWIGESVLVRAGVRIGHGAVVGMGSVVTHDVPPYGIVAGNPARLIRMRFDDDVVAGFLRLAWWDRDDAELRRLAPLFPQPRRLLEQEGVL